MGCCQDNSRRYVKLLNMLISLIGLAISIFAAVKQKEINQLTEGNKYASYVPILAGIVLSLLGGLGIAAAKKQNKFMLVTYFILMFVWTLVVLVMGVVLFMYTGYIEDVKLGKSGTSILDLINDFEVKVYDVCCDGVGPPAQVCNPPILTDGCIIDEEKYNSITVVPEVCDVLEAAGDILTACPAGAAAFQDVFSDFLVEYFNPIAITVCSLAAILLLNLVSVCVLICTNRYDYDREYREKQQQQSGTVAVGGAGTKYT
mmetsp:Transcript_57290/g.125420  ORF Transcript_57290/g.125420 Transcript_57290/m.125420 type:complete len:259 (-) Transcript_57290:28-804(-)